MGSHSAGRLQYDSPAPILTAASSPTAPSKERGLTGSMAAGERENKVTAGWPSLSRVTGPSRVAGLSRVAGPINGRSRQGDLT